MVACLGILITLLYQLMIYYQEKTALIDYKYWDVQTVTAADFTVETFFPDQLWEDFLQRPEVQRLAKKDRIAYFEKLLREELQEILKKEKAVLKEDGVSIAHITFSFNNVEVIKLLAKRGAFITTAQNAKLAAIDQEIRTLVVRDWDKFSKPVAAFITFETQEGYERACNIKGKLDWRTKSIKSDHQFLGHPFALQEA